MTGWSQPLRALFRKNVWKYSQKISMLSHKRMKIWKSTGQILMKLSQSIHLKALQKVYAGILTILIFWPIAPRGRFENFIFGHFWTFHPLFEKNRATIWVTSTKMFLTWVSWFFGLCSVLGIRWDVRNSEFFISRVFGSKIAIFSPTSLKIAETYR